MLQLIGGFYYCDRCFVLLFVIRINLEIIFIALVDSVHNNNINNVARRCSKFGLRMLTVSPGHLDLTIT
jgi:hypothetical protein